MKMKTIHFITEYSDRYVNRVLNYSVSSLTVSNYIRDCLVEKRDVVLNIVSTSTTKNRSYFYWEKQKINDCETHLYLASPKDDGRKTSRRVGQLFIFLQIIFYVLFNTKREDYILIYHSYWLSSLMYLIRKLIVRKYVVFVGEIYTAVEQRSQKEITKEVKIIGGAKAYIYGNDLMSKLFKFSQPYAVCHSSYKRYPQKVRNENENLIHIVYAGKIDSVVVNDAFVAADIALFLGNNYRIHILGYGKREDVENLEKRICEINKTKECRSVSYDGCLFGEEYDIFLNKCDIGLCTRTLPDPYSNYCFPSKTIVYLAHNLIPVCPNVESIKKSQIAESVVFVSEMTPPKIAESIRKINIGTIKNDIVEELDKSFKLQLNKVFN